jgi:glucose-1-phosphate thymidylyltransferase
VDAESSIEGRVVIEKDAAIIGSRVRGPPIIGERTRVVNSYVGPFTSIAADCEIEDSDLEHSVVLEHSRIVGIAGMTDSLVGREVEVTRSEQRPRAPRLMLGDHSKVDLE